MATGSKVEFFQAFANTVGKDGSDMQKLWNLKGLFKKVKGLGCVSSRIGQ